MFYIIIIVSVGVLFSGIPQVNGQCTTYGCKDSPIGTHDTVEDILEDHDHKLHGIYNDLKLKTERLESIIEKMAEFYLLVKYKVCPPGFQYLAGADGCFKVIFQQLNWTEAGDECRRLTPDAHLVAITSAAKQEAINKYLKREFSKSEGSVCLFNDGVRWQGAKHTTWTSGQTRVPGQCNTPYEWKILNWMTIPFNYTNWIILEPSCGHNNEHCTQMVATETFEWNDLNCGKKTCALCEL